VHTVTLSILMVAIWDRRELVLNLNNRGNQHEINFNIHNFKNIFHFDLFLMLLLVLLFIIIMYIIISC